MRVSWPARADAPRRRGPSLRGLLLAAAAVAGCLAGLAAIRLAPRTVRAVEVEGLRHLSRAEAVRLVRVPLGARLNSRGASATADRLAEHPAFSSARVHLGVTGVLHVRVRERDPLAWIPERAFAAAGDGVLLPHLAERNAEWPWVAGLPLLRIRVADATRMREAAEADRRLAARGAGGPGGRWRWRPGPPGSWEWSAGGRTVRLSSPVPDAELTRLERFQREFSGAWAGARRIDMRFTDRVVVAR